MLFTANDYTFLSPDKEYEKEELESFFLSSIEEAKKSGYYSDYASFVMHILKEKYGIYAIYREKFEKMPIHLEVDFAEVNKDDDLPF